MRPSFSQSARFANRFSLLVLLNSRVVVTCFVLAAETRQYDTDSKTRIVFRFKDCYVILPKHCHLQLKNKKRDSMSDSCKSHKTAVVFLLLSENFTIRIRIFQLKVKSDDERHLKRKLLLSKIDKDLTSNRTCSCYLEGKQRQNLTTCRVSQSKLLANKFCYA